MGAPVHPTIPEGRAARDSVLPKVSRPLGSCLVSWLSPIVARFHLWLEGTGLTSLAQPPPCFHTCNPDPAVQCLKMHSVGRGGSGCGLSVVVQPQQALFLEWVPRIWMLREEGSSWTDTPKEQLCFCLASWFFR